MHGLTPYRKLKKSKSVINPYVLNFPVVLMEELLKSTRIFTIFLKSFQSGKYIPSAPENEYLAKEYNAKP